MIIILCIGTCLSILFLIRNNWVYNNLEKTISENSCLPPHVYYRGYDWILLHFWKWNFNRALDEYCKKNNI